MSHPDELDIDFVRTHFPVLSGPWALFENAGGTLAARSVIERTNQYMRETQVQPGASYEASALAAERMAESHRLMAAMINARPDEVMVGPSTTMNVFLLAQAIRQWFAVGDEIIVTNLDHEANNGAWRQLGASGLTVREWRANLDTGGLEPDDLTALLSERTRLVCFTHCSNITGAINDVATIVQHVHDAGALACVDGVAYGPHRAIDVKAWNVDFYLCSLYKLYGPHLGLLYGKREHFEKAANINHFFLENEIPLKLNPGGPNHELTAALAGVTDYLNALHAHHFGETNLPLHSRVQQVFSLMTEHESAIARPFVDFLMSKKNVRILGLATADASVRVPTFSFAVADRDSAEIPALVDRHKVAIRNGHFYAARIVRDLGLEGQHGVIRASMVHYNTPHEVTRLIRALDEVI